MRFKNIHHLLILSLLATTVHAGSSGGRGRPSSNPNNPPPSAPPSAPPTQDPNSAPTPPAPPVVPQPQPPAPGVIPPSDTQQPTVNPSNSNNSNMQNPLAWGGAVALGGIGVGATMVGVGGYKFLNNKLGDVLEKSLTTTGKQLADGLTTTVGEKITPLLKETMTDTTIRYGVLEVGDEQYIAGKDKTILTFSVAEGNIVPGNEYKIQKTKDGIKAVKLSDKSSLQIEDNKLYEYMGKHAQVPVGAVDKATEAALKIAKKEIIKPLMDGLNENRINYMHINGFIADNKTGKVLEIQLAQGGDTYWIKQNTKGELQVFNKAHPTVDVTAQVDLNKVAEHLHQHGLQPKGAVTVIAEHATNIIKKDIIEDVVKKTLNNTLPNYKINASGILIDNQNRPLEVAAELPSLIIKKVRENGTEKLKAYKENGEIVNLEDHPRLHNDLQKLEKDMKKLEFNKEDKLTLNGDVRLFYPDKPAKPYHVKITEHGLQILDNGNPVAAQEAEQLRPAINRYLAHHAVINPGAPQQIVEHLTTRFDLDNKIPSLIEKGEREVGALIGKTKHLVEQFEPTLEAINKSVTQATTGPHAIGPRITAIMDRGFEFLGMDLMTTSTEAKTTLIADKLKQTRSVPEFYLNYEQEKKNFEEAAYNGVGFTKEDRELFEDFKTQNIHGKYKDKYDTVKQEHFRKLFIKYELYQGQFASELNNKLRNIREPMKSDPYVTKLMEELEGRKVQYEKLHKMITASGMVNFKKQVDPGEAALATYTVETYGGKTLVRGWTGGYSEVSVKPIVEYVQPPEDLKFLKKFADHNLAEVIQPYLADEKITLKTENSIFNSVYDHLMTRHWGEVEEAKKAKTVGLSKDFETPSRKLLHELFPEHKLPNPKELASSSKEEVVINPEAKLPRNQQFLKMELEAKVAPDQHHQNVHELRNLIKQLDTENYENMRDHANTLFKDLSWHDPRELSKQISDKTQHFIKNHKSALEELQKAHHEALNELIKTDPAKARTHPPHHPLFTHLEKMYGDAVRVE